MSPMAPRPRIDTTATAEKTAPLSRRTGTDRQTSQAAAPAPITAMVAGHRWAGPDPTTGSCTPVTAVAPEQSS
ncbi:hypothetical protein [Streptomyces sp. NPDC003032]